MAFSFEGGEPFLDSSGNRWRARVSEEKDGYLLETTDVGGSYKSTLLPFRPTRQDIISHIEITLRQRRNLKYGPQPM